MFLGCCVLLEGLRKSMGVQQGKPTKHRAGPGTDCCAQNSEQHCEAELLGGLPARLNQVMSGFLLLPAKQPKKDRCGPAKKADLTS